MRLDAVFVDVWVGGGSWTGSGTWTGTWTGNESRYGSSVWEFGMVMGDTAVRYWWMIVAVLIVSVGLVNISLGTGTLYLP